MARCIGFALAMVVVLGLLGRSEAQTTYTWNQSSSGDWSTADWINGTPVSSADTTLVFGGSSDYSAIHDLGAFTLNAMNLTGTGTRTIGNASAADTITLAGANAALNVASGLGPVTISSSLIYSTNSAITNNSSNLLLLSGTHAFAGGTMTTFAGTGNIGVSSTAAPSNALNFAAGSGVTYTGSGTLFLGPQGINAPANSFDRVVFENEGTYNFVNGIDGGGSTGNFSLPDNALGGANTTLVYNQALDVTINMSNFSSGIMSIGNLGLLSGTLNINHGTVRFGIVNGTPNTGGDLFGNALTLNIASGATFNLAGNGETMGLLTGSGTMIQGGSGLTMNIGGPATWGGVLQGTGAFTINNTNYTFTGNNQSTGNTTINASGRLTLGDGGNSGTVGGNIINNGGLTINRGDDFTFGGIISGTNANSTLNVIGTGTTTLTATNTYTGATTVSNGTLRVQSRTTASAYTVEDGAGIIFRNTNITNAFQTNTLTIGSAGNTNLSFELNGGFPTSSQAVVNVATFGGLSLNGNSTVTVSSAGTFFSGQYPLIRYSGFISGDGFSALTLDTAAFPFRVSGNLVDNSGNSTIDVNIVADFIRWNGNVAGQNWNTTDANWLLNSTNSATTYFETAPNQIDSPVFNDSATNFVVNIPGTVQPNAITVDNSSNAYTFQGAGQISGSTGLIKQGTETLIIATNNDYTGGTTISAGTLQLGNGGNSGNIVGTVAGPGTLAINRSDDFDFNANMAGALNFTKLGNNTVTLTGTNSQTGTVTLSAGVVSIASQNNLGATTVPITFDGGTLRFTQNYTTAGSGSALTQRFTFNPSGGTIDVPEGVSILKRGDQVIGTTGVLNKTGLGIFGLGNGGTSNVGTINILEGIFRLTSARTNSVGALNISDGATLYNLDTVSYTLGSPLRIIADGIISLSGDGANVAGVTGLNSNLYTHAGAYLHTLDENGSANAGFGAPVNLTGTARFTLTALGRNNGNDLVLNTFQREIFGPGGLIKDGEGTMILDATNTYAGPTTVANGALFIGGDNTAATGLITVQSGATLGGSGANGQLGGNTIVNSGGTLVGGIFNGGASPNINGTNSLSVQSVTIETGGRLAANIAGSGTNSSLDVGDSTFNLAIDSILLPRSLAGFDNQVAGSWTLATLNDATNLRLNGASVADGFVFGTYTEGTGASGAVVLDMTQLNFTLTAGDQFVLTRTGTALVLNFVPVPEPATVLGASVLALGAMGLLRRHRRNKSAQATLNA